MARHRLIAIHRCDAGAAMTEAALVMIPLLFFLMLAPTMLVIWAREQEARTEAHRDMLDKTTVVMLIPEAKRTTSGHFNQIAEADRRHVYPSFPPAVAGLARNPNAFISPPGGKSLTVGPQVVDVFPDGFPNQYVEGWQYRQVKPRGGWFAGEIELMRYGAVVRSPWTWLGWPMVPVQDGYWEPQQIQGWYDKNVVEKNLKKKLKLVD